ncbi:MAG: permease [Gemmatimonadetes bacterium 13_2_20CM_69_27]|nr:MAG: permease [Gemmatimonadetes bacterium 13_2_20CM_69_27]OLB57967.1 MAG: permease [Gemmatimonadetes bacterium 13_2_20CM_2_69_23]
MSYPSPFPFSRSPVLTTYARRVGLFSGTMAVIGGIIGGGIFRTPAAVAERVGSPRLALAAWVVGGAIALVGAFCFGELGRRRPSAGGGYVYLRETWGPLPAFLYGWALLLVIATGAIAAVAVTFANYALALAGLSPGLTVPVAIGAIALLSGINYVGVKPAAVTQNVFTILKLAALAALIVAGLVLAVPSTVLHHPPPPATDRGGVVGVVVALGAALVPILFTYGGWQQTNFIAEEIIEPERNLPRALVLGVAGVVIVYLLANVAYLRVLGLGGLARSTAPAADVMRALLGPAGGTLIAAGITASTFGFLNLVILVTPRVLQAMAADGVFLPRLAVLHPRFRTPALAILVQAGWATVLTLSGTFAQLVDYVAFGDWIFFGLTVAGLFIYRAREAGGPGGPGGAGRAFRVPGYPWTPGLFVLAALYVVASSILANPRNALIGAGLLALGVPVYLLAARYSGRGVV